MAPLTSRYRLERRLGAGGMAEVYLAHDTELEREVAIKVLLPDQAADPEKRKRFRSAAKASSVLAHANICMVHEVGETDEGRPFMAMEYVQGQALDDILQRRRLSVSEVIDIGIQVAEALDAAHSRGVVHRDIKPGNIVIGPRGLVKVLDFGLAKRFGEEARDATLSSIFKTQTGVVIGTPHYMSPEQVLGREVDGRTDIFSLGVVLYEALAGQRPFLGRTAGEVMNNVVNQPHEPLGIENSSFPPALETVVMKCLEKDPGQRHQSARCLADDLLRLKNQPEPAPQVAATPAIGPAGSPPGNAATGRRVTRLRPGYAALFGAGAILALIALGLLWRWPPGGLGSPKAHPGGPGTQTSVAVLPFNNFSGEQDTDYLSDGLTEEITTALSRIPGLKVAARNSAFTFKGKNEDVRKMGQALRVGTVLEGSIRKDGKRIRVSAQLVSVDTGYNLWSETYERPLDDILSVQQEIAQRIAERLQGKAPPPVQTVRAVDPEVYKLYLQARMCWNRRNQPGLKQAEQLFKSALEKDPNYAAAQAGLAATYLIIPNYIFPAKESEYWPLAKAAAGRALQLDPKCAEAHAVLGMLAEPRKEDQQAEEHFRRAIELDPNYATAHHWFGNFLITRGRNAEAFAQYKAALEVDPLSPVIHTTIAQWHYMVEDYDNAIVESRKVIEQFPEFVKVRDILVMCYVQKSDFAQALKEIDTARTLQPDAPLALLEIRGYCLARLGREQEAREILAKFEDAYRQGQPAEVRLAYLYAGLKDYDKLMDMLERKFGSEGMDVTMFNDPCMREIRDLPRFKALLHRTGAESVPQKRT